VILRVLRRTTFAHSKQRIKVPLFFLSGGQSCCRSTDWEGARWVACLVRGVNLRIQGLFVSWCFLQPGARVTLITSLSEFISVFKQPTSSVVFCPSTTPVTSSRLSFISYVLVVLAIATTIVLVVWIRTCSSCNSENYRTCLSYDHLRYRRLRHIIICL
jgi:hypothetical protein